MSALISQKSLQTIHATLPAVAANLEKIVGNFYPRMLGGNPDLFQYFNKSNQLSKRQPSALIESIVAYVTHLDNLEAIAPAVDRIAHKHCALNVQPEHYPIVHDNLLASVAEILGEAVTPEVAEAWSEAVMALAGILIKREAELYKDRADAPGGWRGKREFIVDSVRTEGKDIVTLRLRSGDSKQVIAPLPGQYVSVVENPTEEKVFAPRHYTITNSGENWYEITPKRLVSECPVTTSTAPKCPYAGIMSSYLNTLKKEDQINLYPPFGYVEFDVNVPHDCAVFITSGIGITPVVSLLKAANDASIPVAFFHADSSSETHAFRNQLLESLKPEAHVQFFYSHPQAADTTLPHYAQGRMSAEGILSALKEKFSSFDNVHFYLSSNPDLMIELSKGLKADGVPDANVHGLAFGPHIKL